MTDELFSEDEYEYEVSYVPKINSRKSITATVDTIESYINKQHTGYEVILGSVIPYYDWDDYYQTESEQKGHFNYQLSFSYNLVKKQFPDSQILAFTSSGYDTDKKKYKNSFHYRVRGVGYYECGADVPKIEDFDTTVYKKKKKKTEE